MDTRNRTEYTKQRRAKIKADPVKYADWLVKQRLQGKKYRDNRTDEQKYWDYLKHSEWRRKNKSKFLDSSVRTRRKLREELLNAYGNKCYCCNETNKEFLALDHINGGGGKDHKESGAYGVYRRLRNLGYPKEGYRLLCHNCNLSNAFYGYCPHNYQVAKK